MIHSPAIWIMMLALLGVTGMDRSMSWADQPVARQDREEIRDLTFDDISFEMETGAEFEREMLTEKIVDLDKKWIRLRGFIRPSFRQTGLRKFVFVRDNKECCFGPGAALYDCVLVELAEGEETEFTVRPVTIEGIFQLKEFRGPDKKIWAIYRMKEGRVQ